MSLRSPRLLTQCAVVIAFAAGCTAPAPPAAAPPPSTDTGLDFVERVLGQADPTEPLPTIIALHGLGDRPESFGRLFEGYDRPVRLILPRGPQAYGSGARWFSVRVADNRARDLADGITAAATQVAQLIDRLQSQGRIVGLPVVTGFSQGGMVTLALAVQHPSKVRQAIPIGGWLPPPIWPKVDADRDYPPIVALHGRADRIVPFAPSQAALTALAKRGLSARMIPFDDLGHSISGALRDNLFALLDHGLGVRPAPR